MSDDDRPLSELTLSKEHWFACHFPQRPVDPMVRWHYGYCGTCASRADALAQAYPGDSHVIWLQSVTRGAETGNGS